MVLFCCRYIDRTQVVIVEQLMVKGHWHFIHFLSLSPKSRYDGVRVRVRIKGQEEVDNRMMLASEYMIRGGAPTWLVRQV